MSKELASSIDIEAPAQKVWDLLVDFAAYPTWNPFITRAEGRIEVGGRLTLRMQPVGLFDADHLFIVEPHGAGSRLVQQEHFSGLLVPFFQRSLDDGTLPAFHAMNAALKDQAERATAAHG